jgi:hypothetical protein
MAANRHETPLEAFFTTLFTRDAAGGSWLSALLAATPYGAQRLGEYVQSPGWLQTQLAVRTASGRLGCFEYPAVAPRRLLRWFIDHPDQLVWPADAAAGASAETTLLRRALIDDDPPGAQARAQDRARDLLPRSSGLTPAWWRFEDMTTLDCVLITERLVVGVQGMTTEDLSPATSWYPKRSQLVRNLEAARHLADGKRFATLVLSRRPVAHASDEQLERSLPEAASHLDEQERRELHDAFLGNLTWDDACEAVGIPRGSLPDSVAAPEATQERATSREPDSALASPGGPRYDPRRSS